MDFPFNVSQLGVALMFMLLDGLFTAVVAAVALALAFRLLKVRSVTIERESTSRDQDRSD